MAAADALGLLRAGPVLLTSQRRKFSSLEMMAERQNIMMIALDITRTS
jgi:hypothetical protein